MFFSIVMIQFVTRHVNTLIAAEMKNILDILTNKVYIGATNKTSGAGYVQIIAATQNN